MVNYENGKVYKLICRVTGLQYVGSTTQPLTVRKSEHISKYKRHLKGVYDYVTSFKVVEIWDFDIILLEEVKCETKKQLHERERYHIDVLDCVNERIPSRSRSESAALYRKLNKDLIVRQRREYNQQNADKIKAHKKKLYTCACGRTVQLCSRAVHERNRLHLNWVQAQAIINI